MTGPSPPPFRAPDIGDKPTAAKGGLMVFGSIFGIALLVSALGQCSRRSIDNTAAFVDGNVSNAIAVQPPPPPQPLNAQAVTRGTAHLRLAVNAEGFSGAMIYSQNCYDALANQFTWAKLDSCGGFDMLAVRSIANADTTGLDNEAGYFQSEAAAGRFLAAATAAGEPAGEADTRLSDLQTRVRRVPTAGRRPEPEADNSFISNSSGNLLDAPLDDGTDGEGVDDD
jgi:hypothetical protein